MHQGHSHDHEHGDNCNHGGGGHHHGHAHGHGHHHHVPKNFDKAFAIGAFLNLSFVGAELFYGYLARSLALIADAVHNFADVVGLLLAWGAAWLSRRAPTDERTFGYRRASILAALANACLLFLAIGAIIIEALQRFAAPAPINPPTMIWVAGVGILINFGTAMLFWRGQKHDLNLRAAFMHMIADAAISLGVVVAGLIIMFKGWMWIDPAISLVVSVIILVGCWELAKESLHLSMDGVPKHINRRGVLVYLHELPGVTGVHDLHIWAMSTTEVALTVHLMRPGAPIDDAFLHKVAKDLQERFQIGHVTIQIEAGNAKDDCKLQPDSVV
ncbi:MAG TPA: cation diffusion facilitator family transporter [Patescibacteria group bacterium]|nr:cation diffusion facilitator family transporter [Patescibacteria group bacterium]